MYCLISTESDCHLTTFTSTCHNTPFMWECIISYKWVSFPSPENAPSAIDVILLVYMDLHEHGLLPSALWECIVLYIQNGQASKSWKCAIGNRCDIVVIQVPARAVWPNWARREERSLQANQIAKSRKCTISNRRDVVVGQNSERKFVNVSNVVKRWS
jgi:hypothetical protein